MENKKLTRPYPLAAFGVQSYPDKKALVMDLEYLGTDPSGQETATGLPPLAMDAASARGLANLLLMAATELEQATPVAPVHTKQ